MKILKRTPDDYKVTTWSGGETCQLFLSPEQGVYEVGKFDYRISSASIETESSHFTQLPGYHRFIFSLDKPIKLQHNQGEPIALAPFQVHHFSGSDQTFCQGKCRDFNLIYREELSAQISFLKSGQRQFLHPGYSYFLFAPERISFLLETESVSLDAWHSFYLEKLDKVYEISRSDTLVTQSLLVVVAIKKSRLERRE